MKSRSKAVSTKKESGGLVETVKTIVYAVLIALVIRTVAYEPFNIPSGSMIPTLLVGDYLFVSGRVALPISHLPERGEVAVFKLPTDPSTDYIKRIVGLPGDHIQVRHGGLYINDQLAPRRPDDRCADPEDPTGQGYIEEVPRGAGRPPVEHCIVKHGDNNQLDNTPVYEVPPEHYFAMGDNRDNSQDSRVPWAVGYIPAENLVGRAQFIFFSTDGSAHWWEIWKWPVTVRYRRLFGGVG